MGDSQLDQLLEIIKVLGTPSKGEIQEMNQRYDLKEYKKFPNIKSVPWNKVKYQIIIDPENIRPPVNRFSA